MPPILQLVVNLALTACMVALLAIIIPAILRTPGPLFSVGVVLLRRARRSGQARVEWRVTGTPGPGQPPYSHTWPRPGRTEDAEKAAREFVAAVSRGRGWEKGPHLHRRVIVATPWEHVPVDALAVDGAR